MQYGTITTIDASPLNPDLLWVGTDDGNVWVTSDGGGNWTKVSASLPKRWVTRVVAGFPYENYALVCLSGYRHFDDMAHIYQTTNRGQTWQSVSGNLPDLPVNDLVLDPADPFNVWYIATDAGVFVTLNGGSTWQPANEGLPKVPVTDLTVHRPTRTIVAATYGRSMFKATMPWFSSTHSPQTIENVRVAPKPFINQTQISLLVLEQQTVRLELFELSGKRLKTFFAGQLPIGEQVFEVDGNGLAAGIYLIKMTGKNGAGFCHKVVKQ